MWVWFAQVTQFTYKQTSCTLSMTPCTVFYFFSRRVQNGMVEGLCFMSKFSYMPELILLIVRSYFLWGSIWQLFFCLCSAQCRNRDNSGIFLRKVGIPTLSDDSGIVPDNSRFSQGIHVVLWSDIQEWRLYEMYCNSKEDNQPPCFFSDFRIKKHNVKICNTHL